MKSTKQNINISFENIAGKIFLLLALGMYFILVHYSLELTGFNPTLGDEHISFIDNSIILSVLELLICFISLYFFGKLEKYFIDIKRRNILLLVCMILSLLISIYWITHAHSLPQADQESIVKTAIEMNNGDYSSLEVGEYIAILPHLLGIVTFLRLLSLFGIENYILFQIFSAFMVPLTIFAGCMVTRVLSKNIKVELYYLLLAFTCIPMYIYTSFVYGDLVYVPFLLLATWLFLLCLKKFSILKIVGLALSLAMALLFRKNAYIIVIAMIIVLAIKWLKDKQSQIIIMIVAILIGSVGSNKLLRLAYASKWDKNAEAIPTLTWVAMGLNCDDDYPGWWNNLNIELFLENNYDAKKTSEAAKEIIGEYIETYKSDPSFMFKFFKEKINAQWNAPMYQCIVMNSKIEGEQNIVIENLFNGGRLANLALNYMKAYQMVLYASILFMIVTSLINKDNQDIEKYVLLIAVFGGFLVSLFWEAKTRYAFPYLLLQLPYGAIGINKVSTWLHDKYTNIKD